MTRRPALHRSRPRWPVRLRRRESTRHPDLHRAFRMAGLVCRSNDAAVPGHDSGPAPARCRRCRRCQRVRRRRLRRIELTPAARVGRVSRPVPHRSAKCIWFPSSRLGTTFCSRHQSPLGWRWRDLRFSPRELVDDEADRMRGFCGCAGHADDSNWIARRVDRCLGSGRVLT